MAPLPSRRSERTGKGEGGVLAQLGAIETIINRDKVAKKRPVLVEGIPQSVTVNPMAPDKSADRRQRRKVTVSV